MFWGDCQTDIENFQIPTVLVGTFALSALHLSSVQCFHSWRNNQSKLLLQSILGGAHRLWGAKKWLF